MKVEKVSYNSFYNVPQRAITPRAYQSKPSFNGNVPQKELIKELKNILPYSMRMLSKLAENMGEVQNIVINSLSTGLIAPIFIKYNPLSKTDEDTRTYSAWRQPLSAVLAVATQAGMVIPFNSIISDMAFSGDYPEEYNMTNLRDEKYFSKKIKKTEPHLTKEQLNKKVQNAIAQQHKELLENIRFKNQILLKTPNSGTVKLSEKAYNDTILDTIQSLIKSDTAKQKSCETKATKRLLRSQFLSNHNPEIKTVLEEVKKELDAAPNLNTMKSFLKVKTTQLKKAGADNELIGMITEIQDRIKKISTPPKIDGQQIINPKEVIMQELRDKTNKMLAHVNKYANIKDEKAIAKEVEKSVSMRKNAFEKSLELLKDIENRIVKNKETFTISQLEDMIKEKSKGVSFKDSALHVDFAEEFITKYKNNIKNNLKSHKQFTGLVISLAVLPITCCLLNWVYPRFMDAIFPNLSNKKHDNESKQLVDKAPKQVGGAA